MRVNIKLNIKGKFFPQQNLYGNMTYKPKYRSSPLKKINYREFKRNDLNIISKVGKCVGDFFNIFKNKLMPSHSLSN